MVNWNDNLDSKLLAKESASLSTASIAKHDEDALETITALYNKLPSSVRSSGDIDTILQSMLSMRK